MSPTRERSPLNRKTPVEALTIVPNEPLRHSETADLIRQSEDLIEQSKGALARFLAIEIDTGLTFVELARAKDMRIEPERRTALKSNAELAARTVKRFKGRLDDESRRRIESRLAELERAISFL